MGIVVGMDAISMGLIVAIASLALCLDAILFRSGTCLRSIRGGLPQSTFLPGVRKGTPILRNAICVFLGWHLRRRTVNALYAKYVRAYEAG